MRIMRNLWLVVIVTCATNSMCPSRLLGQANQSAQGDHTAAMSRMAQRIDQLINARLKEQGLQPEALCDDVTFLRRLSLDLTGRNPSATEVVNFQRDTSPDKRAKAVDRLLSSPTCAVHLANIWSAWLLPEMQEIGPPGGGANGLHTWLRNRFANNLRYDRLVADLLVASGPTTTGPSLFFLALEGKPEKIAAKTSRVFMGVQLDCAECHDHPFDSWKQRDFWGFAAYFAQLSADGMQRANQINDREAGEVMLPGTQEVISPKPLVATGLSGLESGSRRQQLTLWLTARENPYLARAAVNRCWSILFGRGLIEPIDDMRSLEMASHPELLEELSNEFAHGGYDLRELLRTLANTQAYQRRSLFEAAASASSKGDDKLASPAATELPLNSYATMPLKPLTATQLATCLHQVARDITGEDGRNQAAALARQLGKLRGDGSTATLGIVQALVTLHSSQLDSVHASEQSKLLQALAAPHLNTDKRIEWMFLSTLGRWPQTGELDAIRQLSLDSAPADANSATTSTSNSTPTQTSTSTSASTPTWQADLLWALVNSTEFAMTP